MLRRARSWLVSRSLTQCLCIGLAGALCLEALTCALRFGCGLNAADHTRVVAPWTFGFRLHHGYFGIGCVLLAVVLRSKKLRNPLLIGGIALLVSDLIHHFVVLWLFTGWHHFDIRYALIASMAG